MATTIFQPNQASPANPSSVVRCEHHGCRMAGVSHPKPPSAEGGDWMRVSRVRRGFIACIGDASGHGDYAAPAGRMMRLDFDAAIHRGLAEPVEILEHMNASLYSRRKLAAATVVYCDGTRLVTATAGALGPTVFHRGSAETLPARGRILGISPSLDLEVVSREIPPGALIALHSDGVTETENPETGVTFNIGRFAEVIDPRCSVASNLVACLTQLFAHGPQHDDVSLLLLHASGNLDTGLACAAFALPPEWPPKPPVAVEYDLAIA